MSSKISAPPRRESCLCTPEDAGTVTPNIKPQAVIEEPKHLPTVIVCYSRLKRKPQYESEPKKICRFNFCRWYKKRKALRSLKRDKEKEREKERKRIREEYERERIDDIIRWDFANQLEKKTKHHKPQLRIIPQEEKKKEIAIIETKRRAKPRRTWKGFKNKVKRNRTYVKEQSASAKPRIQTKKVSVKKYKPKYSLTNRFVNYCYRICCQFYCCITCILVIAFVVMFIL